MASAGRVMRWSDCVCRLQSLVFWAGVPVVWMLVTLLIITMYFCYRCCQRETEKSTPCIKWAIGILDLLSWQVSQRSRDAISVSVSLCLSLRSHYLTCPSLSKFSLHVSRPAERKSSCCSLQMLFGRATERVWGQSPQ